MRNLITLLVLLLVPSFFGQVVFEESSPEIVYSGTWGIQEASGAHGGYTSYTTEAGATACITYNGGAVTYVTYTRTNRGHVIMRLDGQEVVRSNYSPKLRWDVRQTYYLGEGDHFFCIEAVGDGRIDLDQFVIHGENVGTPTPEPSNLLDCNCSGVCTVSMECQFQCTCTPHS